MNADEVGPDRASGADPAHDGPGHRHRGAVTWLCYGMLGFFSYFINSLGPILSFLRADLDLSYTVTSFHSSAFAIGMIVAGVSANVLATTLGRHMVFWLGGSGMSLGTVILVAGRHPAMTVAGALLMGYLGSLLAVMISAILADEHGPRRAAMLMEANVVASACGMVAPILIGGAAATGFGWQVALLVPVASFAVAGTRFRSMAFPVPVPPAGHGTTVAGDGLPGPYWAFWAVLLLIVAVEFATLFWAAAFLEDVVGLSRATSAAAVSLFLGGMLVGRFAGSRLMLAGRRGGPLLLVSLATTSAAFALYWLAPSVPLTLVGLTVMGLGTANLYPLTLSLAIEAAGGRTDLAATRASLAAGVAIVAASIVLGRLADLAGIAAAYGVVAVLLAGALVAALFALHLSASGAHPAPGVATAP
ncbi:MAG: MFS transporter [Thermomicrobiales bacterium]